MSEWDERAIFLLKKRLSKDINIELVDRLVNHFPEISIKGPIEELFLCRSYLIWRPDTKLLLFFSDDEENDGEHFLGKGERQVTLTVTDAELVFPSSTDVVRKFVSVFCNVCDILDPFFGFTGHEQIMDNEVWVERRMDGTIESALRYLEEMNTQYLRTIYLDNKLYSDIPMEYLSKWAGYHSQCGSKGHLISCLQKPFDITDRKPSAKMKEKNEWFNSKILPIVVKRITAEFSDIL